MRMHGLCKSISSTTSSCAFPITSNVYFACRAVGVPKLLFPCQSASLLNISPGTPPLPFKCSQVFCFTELNPSYTRLGLLPSFAGKASAVAYHSFTSTRSLHSAPKRTALRNPLPNPNSSSITRKGQVKARKDSETKSKPVQAQKQSSPKQKQAETKRSLKPVEAKSSSKQVQARTKSSAKPVQTKTESSLAKSAQAKAKASPKLVQKEVVVDEEEDSEDDDDFDEDEDFDDEDEDFNHELIDEEGADDDELMDENDAFIDDMLDEEGEGVEEIMLGDGGDGGGVNVSQTQWGEKALSIAKGVLEEFGSNFSLYAFKTSFENRIYVRLDKHSDRYGSPTMVEIESFSTIYGKRLEEAGQDGILPENLALEVSSPGAERVVQVPDQLTRFKDLPMLVRYEEVPVNESLKRSPVVKDSILELATFEVESGKSVWKLANVRANREQAGKGRGLTKKQKEWRTELPLSSLRLVRLYMDI